MRLNQPNLWHWAKFTLVSKIFPVKTAEILLLDKTEVCLRATKINRIHIPFISSPQLSDKPCFTKPDLNKIKVDFPYVRIITCNHSLSYNPAKLIEDFTGWFKDHLKLIDHKKEKKCIHGLRETLCFTCLQKESRNEYEPPPGVERSQESS